MLRQNNALRNLNLGMENTTIDIGCCSIEDEGATAIAHALYVNLALSHIDLCIYYIKNSNRE